MRFPGAWDVAFGKWVIERYEAFELVPHQEWLETAYEEIRLAATPDGQTLLIFVPYNVSGSLKVDLSAYRFEGINLETRNIFYPLTTFTAGQWHIEMAEMNSDCLLIGKRG